MAQPSPHVTRLLKSSIARKTCLLLVLSSSGAFVSFFLFWNFHVHTNPASLSLAVRQQMRALQLGTWADMVASGQEEDRAGLRERVATFDKGLTVLEQGGEIEGFTVSRIPEGAATEAVTGLRSLWRDLRPVLLVIADSPVASPEVERAHRDLRPAIETLKTKSSEMTRLLEGQIREKRIRILQTLGAVAVLSLILLVLGLWYAIRFIVGPILLIEGAARGVHNGDFSVRVQVPLGNELSSLARTFNEMVVNIQNLLVTLEQRRKYAEVITNNMPVGLALLDERLAVIRSERSFLEMVQLSEADICGCPVTEILPCVGLADHLLTVIESGEPVRGLTYELDRPDGTKCSVRINAAATRLDEAGEEARLILLVEDLTEEERLRVDAQVAQARLTHLIASSPVVIYAAQPFGDYCATFVTDSAVTQLGYEPRELTEDPSFWINLVHAEDRKRVITEVSTLPEHGRLSTEYRFRHKDGTYKWIRDESRLLRDAAGRPTEIVGFRFDVTARKEAEESLRLQSAALNSAANTIMITDFDGTIVWINAAFTVLTGYTPEQAIGRNPRELLKSGQHDQAFYRLMWDTILAGRVWHGELINRKRDGSLYTEEMTITPVKDESGATTHFVTIKEDITERKRADEALTLFRALIDRSNDAIEVIDPDTGSFLDVNEKGFTSVGYSREEFLSLKVFDIDPLIDLAGFAKVVDELRETEFTRIESVHQRKDTTTFPVEVNLRYVQLDRGYLVSVARDISDRTEAQEQIRLVAQFPEENPSPVLRFSRDGKILYVNRSSQPLLDFWELRPGDYLPAEWSSIVSQCIASGERVEKELRCGNVIFSLLIVPIVKSDYCNMYGLDISERVRAEEQLIQSQKLESVGQLAGGVAHDFNNLLSVIMGYAEFAMQTLSEGDPLRDDIQQIHDAGDRAAALTRQLLAFSRKQIFQPEVLDLNRVVFDAEKMLRRLIGEDIYLVFVPAEDLALVKADPGQIEQVIMNLAVNARDAMPDGGKLTFETSNVKLDEAYAASHLSAMPGPYVLLVVSDSGIGMDKTTCDQIFEPFFTTKEKGKGTGLGLATVYGIVKQSGGNIWVYSEIGKGTTFKIYLPQTEDTAQEGRLVRTEVIARGTETILVVEDEVILRNLAQRILEDAGYTVLPAADGGEALRMLESYDEPVHLLVTDVIMPGMSGRELTERLAKLRPELKILYMSGYTDDAIVRHGVLDEGTRFIAKPFSAVELTRKVREVLDSPGPEGETA